VCENRVLRRIFGHKGEEVAGDWRRLRNEEVHNLYPQIKYCYGDEIKEDEVSKDRTRMMEMRNA
jgi:hypothetical protein